MTMESSSFSPSADKEVEDLHRRFQLFSKQHWYAEAADVGRQWLEKSKSVWGPNHPDTLSIMYLRGTALYADGKLDDAEEIFRELLSLRNEKLGLDHRDTIATLDAVCETLCGLCKYDESMRLLEEELRLCENAFGLQHELTIKTLRNAAQIYRMKNDPFLASAVLLRALELSTKGFGRDHPCTAGIQDELNEIRGPQDSLALRQALAAKNGLPIPGDLLSGLKSIDISQLLAEYQDVSGFVSGGVELTNASMMRLGEVRGILPQPALRIPSAFESETSEDESLSESEFQSHAYEIPVFLIGSTATASIPSSASVSAQPFRSLVERSIEAWKQSKSTRGRTRAITKHSQLLRGLDTLDDFLNFGDHQYWFFQLREAFMRQKAFEKWSPDRLDDYVLLPIEAGFANENDCLFLSHYWHLPEHPDDQGADLGSIQQLLSGGFWSQITYFWVDFTCLPQRPNLQEKRPGPQQKYFSRVLKSIPRLVRDCTFTWHFPQFRPRLWVLFEAAEFTGNRSQPIPRSDMEPFMRHLREMKGYGVRYVLNRYGYRCTNQSDLVLVVGWLEILLILSRLVPSIRTRRAILDAVDNYTVRTCYHEQSGIAVDKSKGFITMDERTYEFTPVPFDATGPHRHIHIPVDSWRKKHLQRELRRAERAPDDRGHEEIACENETEGEYEIAEALHRVALADARTKNNISLIVSLDFLAGNLEKQRRYKDAETFRREQLTLTEEDYRPDHIITRDCMEKLAMAVQNGELTRYFRRWKQEPLEEILEVNPPSFPDAGQSHEELSGDVDLTAKNLESQGRFTEAEEALWLLLEWRKKELGPYHTDTLTALSNLAKVLRLEGKLTASEKLFWVALSLSDDKWGPEHLNTLAIMSHLAVTMVSGGKKAEAKEIYRQLLERQLRVVDFDHPDTFTAKFNLMEILDEMNETFEIISGGVRIQPKKKREVQVQPDERNRHLFLNDVASLMRP